MLNLVTYPNTVLHEKCEDVTVFDDELKKLVNDMAELMYASNGIGLAANQVGVSKNIILVDVPSKDWLAVEGLIVMINPKIRGFGKDKVVEEEGCLSLPGVFVHVQRTCNINVEYYDVDGKMHLNGFSGLQARVIQHECDHLNGLTMVDIVGPLARKMALKNLTAPK